MKRLQVVVILMILIVVIPLASFANEITEEDITVVKNPDRGFYRLIQKELQKGDEDYSEFEKQIKATEEEYPDVSIISFQLNLINYVKGNTDITNSKIKNINEYFSIMRKHGYKVIFRVVYDSKGAKNPEPEFDIILRQIEQLKDVYITNKDIIFVVEAGYLGSYGEWHDGKYDKELDKKNKIIKKLLEVIPEEIQINLRKPQFITEYIGNKQTISENNSYSNEEIARLGLHNDGYLASETDLGTYEKNERTESLIWQSEQTKYTAFGGEAQNKNSVYNDLKNAIEDMKNRHCNYLNRTYDREVKEKWKNTKYTGNDSNYIGKDGMTYIQNHLGYRLLLQGININGKKTNESADVSIVLQNIGFGNIIKEKKIELIYTNGTQIYRVETDIDIRKQLQDNRYILKINDKLPQKMEQGNYKVYLSIGEPYESLKENSNYYIKIVNKDFWNEELKANYLGNIEIQNNNNQELNNSIKLEYLDFIKLMIGGIIILIIALIFINKNQNKK